MGGYLEIARPVKEKRDSSSHLTRSRPLHLQRSPWWTSKERRSSNFQACSGHPSGAALRVARNGAYTRSTRRIVPSAKKPWREGRGLAQGGDKR
jgi:hypothetical protein